MSANQSKQPAPNRPKSLQTDSIQDKAPEVQPPPQVPVMLHRPTTGRARVVWGPPPLPAMPAPKRREVNTGLFYWGVVAVWLLGFVCVLVVNEFYAGLYLGGSVAVCLLVGFGVYLYWLFTPKTEMGVIIRILTVVMLFVLFGGGAVVVVVLSR